MNFVIPRGAGQAARRRLAVGAEVQEEGTSFRVWAPARERISVVVEGAGEQPLSREDRGYFSGLVAGIAAGARYRFRLDFGEETYPDPASRYQPEGPHGPSEVVDPSTYGWSDQAWPGIAMRGQVISEIHIGTFTPEGTWAAAAARLPLLKETGITVVEMMPVAEFPGRFGWGYDGVDLFAPARLYGTPDDLRRFVDCAHGLGLGVILDVVYNHFGPDGCYLKPFTPDYFTARHENDWGEAVNFDGRNAHGVREFILANARYWIEEFHFDGLRLDATQDIHDRSDDHILAAIAREARAAAKPRSIVLIGENEPQNARLATPAKSGGYGLDALWNDDFHHSAIVALTGRAPAYYSDHKGRAQEFVSAAKYGFLFQGQRYSWQDKPRGTPSFALLPEQFVLFTENHDQVANSAWGLRTHQLTTPGRARAITALLLLLPGTPLLFQGQEFWSSSRFLYFADHNPEIASKVADGRRTFLAQFRALASEEMGLCIADPAAWSTFTSSKLDWSDRERNVQALSLHRDLLRLRRDDPVFAAQRPRMLDGAVLSDEAFLLRFFGGEAGDRLMLVNFGPDLELASIADPLAAPPMDCAWRLSWSSEWPAYGGCGVAPILDDEGWHITGHSAVVLASRPLCPLSDFTDRKTR